MTGEGAELGPALIEESDYVGFTGSTATGRKVARQAGEQLVGCSLELGGKNPMLVLADADLDEAVPGSVRGCFSSAGQLCISIERLYAHSSLYGRFLRRFVEAAQLMKLGAGLDYDTDMGSLVSAAQLAKVEEHVQDAVRKGATVHHGGRRRPDLGPYFYEPTILSGVTPEMTLYAEETFGPVVALYEFDTINEAVERANATPYGLNASVWTRDTALGHRVATRLRCGTVNVNEAYAAAWGSVDSPMGGMKLSGLGRRHGAEGILKYTEAQTVAIQRGLQFAPPSGVSEETWSKALSQTLKLLRRVPGLRVTALGRATATAAPAGMDTLLHRLPRLPRARSCSPGAGAPRREPGGVPGAGEVPRPRRAAARRARRPRARNRAAACGSSKGTSPSPASGSRRRALSSARRPRSSTSPRSTTSRCRALRASRSTSKAPGTCSTSPPPARGSAASSTSRPATSPAAIPASSARATSTRARSSTTTTRRRSSWPRSRSRTG